MSDRRPPLATVGLVSATAIGYELLLVRLISIIQWHHLAPLVISLALLGYGASGAALTPVWRRGAAVRRRLYPGLFPWLPALLGITALASFLIAQRIVLSPEEIVWAPSHLGRFVAFYLVLVVPFFCAGLVVGLALLEFPAPRVYAADLAGAGCGALGVVGLLELLHPAVVLRVVAGLGLLAAMAAARASGRPARWNLVPAAGLVALVLAPTAWTRLELSPYKDLAQVLRRSGARIIAERTSGLGLIDVVESPLAPFREAPGLSLLAVAGPPEQLGLLVDGDGIGAVAGATPEELAGPRDTRSPTAASLGFLDQLPSAAAYHVTVPHRVLIVAAGAGEGVLQALVLSPARVDAAERNRQIVELLRGPLDAFTGGLYRNPRVTVHVTSPRALLAASGAAWDLIQLPVGGPLGATLTGLESLGEDDLRTVEAFVEYLEHLTPGGFLQVSEWTRLPPRALPKLAATAAEALRRVGVGAPERSIAAIRGLQTATLLVKRGELRDVEVGRLRAFAESRAFDLVWIPGMTVADANRFNRLGRPLFFEAVRTALAPPDGRADRTAGRQRSPFDLRPATDDRPFYAHSFRWRALPEVLRERRRSGWSLVDAGYLLLLVTLAQAVVWSLVLILVPLAGGRVAVSVAVSRLRAGTVFGSLGLAFLFIEIASLERLIRLFRHPVLATAVTLTTLLLFGGFGSRAVAGCSPARLTRSARRAIVAVLLFGGFHAIGLDPLFDRLAGAGVHLQVAAAVAALAPLAVAMGMPFPLALRALKSRAPELAPWAWGINGCAAVVSSVLAALMALHWGFRTVILAALGLYAIAGLAFPAGEGRPSA